MFFLRGLLLKALLSYGMAEGFLWQQVRGKIDITPQNCSADYKGEEK